MVLRGSLVYANCLHVIVSEKILRKNMILRPINHVTEKYGLTRTVQTPWEVVKRYKKKNQICFFVGVERRKKCCFTKKRVKKG